ncbi:hypothetical protein LINPERPRIM_LOCUS19457 [Linum perenne]
MELTYLSVMEPNHLLYGAPFMADAPLFRLHLWRIDLMMVYLIVTYLQFWWSYCRSTIGEERGLTTECGLSSLVRAHWISRYETRFNGDLEMEPSIEQIISRTALLSCDEPTVELTREGDRSERMAHKSLVGRFVGDRECSVTTIKNNAQRLWKLKGDLRVRKIQQKNAFVFSFFEHDDKKKVEEGSPWMVLQSHLIMRSWEGHRDPEEVIIDSTEAWVWMWGLAPDLRGKNNIMKIARMFKGLVDYEETEEDMGEWKSFVRVRMEIYLDKPLPTGFQSPSENGGVDKVEFAYEHIPDFCYCCGIMGHTISFCELRMKNIEFFDKNPTKYGSHMKVEGSGYWRGRKLALKNKEKMTPSAMERLPRRGDNAMGSEINREYKRGSVPFSQRAMQFETGVGGDGRVGEYYNEGTQDQPAIFPPWVAGYNHHPYFGAQFPSFQLANSYQPWPNQRFSDGGTHSSLVSIAVNLACLSVYDIQCMNTHTLGKKLLELNQPHITEAVRRGNVDRLKKELEQLTSLPYTADVYALIDEKQKELVRLWKMEEEYWADRAKVEWARFGDRNTRFFHLSTIQRRRRNTIQRVRVGDEEWIDEPREVRAHIRNFFKELFTAPREVIDYAIIGELPRVIDEGINTRLCRQVDDWEIKQAVFQLGPNKSPGPDGFAGSFFQRHWEGPVVAEAYAVLSARKLAARRGRSAEVWTDCQQVVKACESQEDDGPWECSAIIAEIKAILIDFPEIQIVKCSRSSIAAADGIARKARDQQLDPFWLQRLQGIHLN